MPRKQVASNEMLRCRPSVIQRGQLRIFGRIVTTMPSATLPLSKRIATTPVARARYHSIRSAD